MRKRRQSNLAPLGLLLMALVIRLGCEPGLLHGMAARAESTETEPQTEVVSPKLVQQDKPQGTEIPPVSLPTAVPQEEMWELQLPALSPVEAQETPPEWMTLELGDAAAQTLQIRNQTGYTISLQELSEQRLWFDTQAAGPTILLVHTHTTEAYTPEPGWEYEASDTMRTMDSRYNMVRIGDEVERVLTEAGFWVIHDERINDYPSYNGSYAASLACVEEWLARYPSIQIVLDLHRDAAEDGQGGYITTSCMMDGTEASQLMLVCGTDYGGLEHPNWRGNLAFAAQLQLELEQQTPGICRPLDLRCERFNQHTTAMSLLVEVGTVGDTLADALPAAQALGMALAELLGND